MRAVGTTLRSHPCEHSRLRSSHAHLRLDGDRWADFRERIATIGWRPRPTHLSPTCNFGNQMTPPRTGSPALRSATATMPGRGRSGADRLEDRGRKPVAVPNPRSAIFKYPTRKGACAKPLVATVTFVCSHFAPSLGDIHEPLDSSMHHERGASISKASPGHQIVFREADG